MTPKIIPNPYTVFWDYTNLAEETYIDEWCDENLVHGYQFLGWRSGGGPGILYQKKPINERVSEEDIISELAISTKCLVCLFECPRDAMLFKLTWVDNG